MMNSINDLKGQNALEIHDSEIKSVLLDIMVEIHEFCESRGIEYTLWGGTLLGAIRHNGFIPWDDDIDIAMTRENYDRFLNEFDSEHFEAVSCEKDKHYICSFAKVFDKRTIKDEAVHYGNPYRTGIEVDIFPLEEYQDYALIQKSEKQRAKLLYLWNLSIMRRTQRHILKDAILFILRATRILQPNRIARKINRLCRKLSHNGHGLFLYADSNIKKPLRLEKAWYEPIVLHQFEQYQFKIPHNYDAVLRLCYGDYMTLPPVEKRISHHSFKAYRIGRVK